MSSKPLYSSRNCSMSAMPRALTGAASSCIREYNPFLLRPKVPAALMFTVISPVNLNLNLPVSSNMYENIHTKVHSNLIQSSCRQEVFKACVVVSLHRNALDRI